MILRYNAMKNRRVKGTVCPIDPNDWVRSVPLTLKKNIKAHNYYESSINQRYS